MITTMAMEMEMEMVTMEVSVTMTMMKTTVAEEAEEMTELVNHSMIFLMKELMSKMITIT